MARKPIDISVALENEVAADPRVKPRAETARAIARCLMPRTGEVDPVGGPS
jgi:hypothetical protein